MSPMTVAEARVGSDKAGLTLGARGGASEASGERAALRADPRRADPPEPRRSCPAPPTTAAVMVRRTTTSARPSSAAAAGSNARITRPVASPARRAHATGSARGPLATWTAAVVARSNARMRRPAMSPVPTTADAPWTARTVRPAVAIVMRGAAVPNAPAAPTVPSAPAAADATCTARRSQAAGWKNASRAVAAWNATGRSATSVCAGRVAPSPVPRVAVSHRRVYRRRMPHRSARNGDRRFDSAHRGVSWRRL